MSDQKMSRMTFYEAAAMKRLMVQKALKHLSRAKWTKRGAGANVLTERNKELQKVLKNLSTDPSVTPEC